MSIASSNVEVSMSRTIQPRGMTLGTGVEGSKVPGTWRPESGLETGLCTAGRTEVEGPD